MRISEKKKSIKQRQNVLVILILLLVACASLLALEKTGITDFIDLNSDNGSTQNNNASKIDTNPPTNEQVEAGEQIKNGSTDQTTEEFSVSVSPITIDSQYIKIQTVISGVISSSGMCELTLSKSSENITKTAPTYAMPTYSTCQGFNINTSDLSNGQWTARIKVTIGENTASTEETFDLES